MRKLLILLPALMFATPAIAQQAPSAPNTIQLPPQLTDPATINRVTRGMQAMSKALLDIRVGELQAAVEGREATPAERRMTVRDVARRDDPNFERNLQRQIAQAQPMMQQAARTLNEALPAMMDGLQQASRAIERAAANMPDPTYPKR
ncbi:hypothetical protein GCM10022276_15430 [Sphingomonas limnosediminicola]|jgi:hypothetical protein|uniref:Spy/CpxP family protein refolding chaperone n=1 Tax=Sphingomonas limnosediminicola TaxID=940133 RepID=A0ABP7L978_9SPHN